MKKLALMPLLVIPFVFPLTSCGLHGGQKNCFMEGEFIAKNKENDVETIYFDVKEITKEKYKESNGINTVYDVVIKKYFSLNLYIMEEGSTEKESIIFKNMKMVDTDEIFCLYEDDDLNHIRPYVMCYEDKKNYETYALPVYTIYENKGFQVSGRYYATFHSAIKENNEKELVV